MRRCDMAGIGLAAALLAPGGGAAARDALLVELNRLESVEAGCQAFMVVENGLDAALATLTLDLVTFDGEGLIGRRLAVELGPARAGRPTVTAFVVEGRPCDAIARVLVNGVLACADDAGPRADCADALATRSRVAADLVY